MSNITLSDFVYNPATVALAVTGASYAAGIVASSWNPFTATIATTALVAFVADAVARVAGKTFSNKNNGDLANLRDALTVGLAAWAASWLNNNVISNSFAAFGVISNNGTIAIAVAVFAARFAVESLKELYNDCSKKEVKSV